MSSKAPVQREGKGTARHRLQGTANSKTPAGSTSYPKLFSGTLTPADALLLQRTIGNRAAGPLLSHTPLTLQRMVLNLTPGKDKGIDKDAENMTKQDGGPLVFKLEDLQKLKNGETLHIAAHLEEGKIWGQNPEGLADLLAPFLKEKEGITIDLHGCFAAHPGAVNKKAVIKSPTDLWGSYAGRFQTQLAAVLKKNVPVIASLGAEYTSGAGNTRVRTGTTSHKDINEYVSKYSGNSPKKAEALTNSLIEGEEGSFFWGKDEGRIKFQDQKKDDMAPLKDGWDSSFNDPSEYEIVE